MPTPARIIPSGNSGGSNLATLTTGAFTPAAGEALVIIAEVEQGDRTFGTISDSAAALTWSPRGTATGAADCRVQVWTAKVGATSPGSITVSVTRTGSPGEGVIGGMGLANADIDATPIVVTTTGDTDCSFQITPEGANSIIVWGAGDWNAASGTPAYRSSATQLFARYVGTAFGGYAAYQTAGAAGTPVTFGMTAPTGQQASMVAIEILDVPAGTAHTRTVTDAVGVTDSTARSTATRRSVTDPVGVTDSTARTAATRRTTTDPIGITDSASASTGTGSTAHTRTVTDTIGISDSTARTVAHRRSRTDPIGVLDSTSRAVASGPPGVPFLPAALGASGRLVVEIAWGADLTADPAAWTWTDVTRDVRLAPGISATRGRSDEASASQPASCTLTLDNASGRYSLGPQSPNYPYVRRNTPVRVRVAGQDGTLRVLHQGYATSWTPSWNLRGTDRTVRLESAGTLRRLLQGATPVVSPIRRALLDRTDVLAYWPCEDGAASTYLAGAVGDRPMAILGYPDLASSDAFACSAGLPVLRGSAWRGEVPPHVATGAVQVRALVAFPDADEVDGACLLRVHTSGTAARWDIRYESGFGGSLSAAAYDRFGTLIAGTGDIGFNVQIQPRARRLSVEMVQSGADVTWRFSTLAADATAAGYSVCPTLTGRSLGMITAVEVNPDGVLDEVVVGHVSVQNAQTSIFDDLAQLNAYTGETTLDRWTRLCAEQGIPQTISGDLTAFDTTADRMGAQPIAAVTELLREVETADQGVLFDGIGPGVALRSRRSAENRTATVAIDAGVGALQLAPPFGPIDDDQRTRNRVTARRSRGSSAVLEDRDGPLGVDVIGLYDTSVEVNTHVDAAVPLYAGWLLAKGTVEGYRYPAITVDLLATPGLAAAWLQLRPGHRIDVVDVDEALPGHPDGTVSLLVEGISDDLTGTTWTGTARCSPYETWRIGVVAAETGDVGEYVARADTDGSTLAAAAAAGATSISVATASGPLWTRAADDYPLDLEIAGRRVTATACTGSSSPQTFTVAPLAYALPAGADVRLWRPTRLGL